MKTIRNLILSSASGLVALGGAQAADLPVKAKAVEYVRICSLYGDGFFFIPGTDTCIKIGGYLRVDTTFNGGVYGVPDWNGDPGQQNRFSDNFVSRSRMALTVDTRTATEYGVVRTFGEGRFQFNNFGSSNPSTLSAFPGGAANALKPLAAATSQWHISSSSSPASPSVSRRRPMPRRGKDSRATSPRTCWAVKIPTPASTTSSTPPSSATACRPRSASTIRPCGIARPSTIWASPRRIGANGTGSNAYAGTHAPDIVGNIRVDQAWGLFQLSAAAHEVSGSYNTLARRRRSDQPFRNQRSPRNQVGRRGDGRVADQEPPDRCGRRHQARRLLCKGRHQVRDRDRRHLAELRDVRRQRLRLPERRLRRDHRRRLYSGRGWHRRYPLTTAWGVRGAFNHNWDPYWSSSLFGSYSAVRYDGGANDNLLGAGTTTAKGAYCAAFAASHPGQALVGNAAGAYTCNPDFNVSQLGVNLRWTPIKNLTFTGEVQWFHLDQKMSGCSVFTATAPKPTALYEFKDQERFCCRSAPSVTSDRH